MPTGRLTQAPDCGIRLDLGVILSLKTDRFRRLERAESGALKEE